MTFYTANIICSHSCLFIGRSRQTCQTLLLCHYVFRLYRISYSVYIRIRCGHPVIYCYTAVITKFEAGSLCQLRSRFCTCCNHHQVCSCHVVRSNLITQLQFHTVLQKIFVYISYHVRIHLPVKYLGTTLGDSYIHPPFSQILRNFKIYISCTDKKSLFGLICLNVFVKSKCVLYIF